MSASLPVQIKTEIILVFVPTFVRSLRLRYFLDILKHNFFLLKYCCGGPWWWSSGQPACLLLRRSEFESCRRLIFFSVKVVFEKNENKQKEDVFGPFFKKLLWQFLKILGYFKFQHLVTLPRRDTFLGNANS